MDSSSRGFSSSGKLPNPSFSGESNENEFIPNEMDHNCKSQNPNKPEAKNFMSPTESTKSKVVVSRKRVLGERIEPLVSCDSSHAPPKPRTGGRYSACSCNSKSDDEDVLSKFSWDSSMKPYDPRTNYESPRPKYLRYKPERRRRISVSFTSKNQEFLEGEKGSESDQEPLECSSESLGVEAENEDDHAAECTEEEEEVEEEEEGLEEEKGGILKGIVKFLLLLAAVALSTSYISTMSDPLPSPVVEAVGVLRDGFYNMHRYLSEAVFPNVDSSHAWVNGSSLGLHTGDVQTGYLERNSGIVHTAEPSNNGLICDDGEMEDDLEIAEEKEADDEETDRFQLWDFTESDEANDKESDAKDVAIQIPSGIIDDCEFRLGNQSENDHSSDNDEESYGGEKPQEMAKIEPVEAITTESDELVEAADSIAMESDEPMEAAAATSTVESEIRLKDEELKGGSEMLTTDGGLSSMKAVRSINLANWLYILSTAIMASLACIYYSVRAKQAHEPDPLHEVSERKEELISERPLVKFQHKPEKAEKPSSSACVEETTTEQRAETQAAPIVELLAELDIQEYSSSLRSCVQKGKVKTEESVVHVESRTPPVASNSGDSSSSYGSLTVEKSALRRKQASREKDAKMVPTPTRRSSRIRNLSITSP